jgi:hypothetical protein
MIDVRIEEVWARQDDEQLKDVEKRRTNDYEGFCKD